MKTSSLIFSIALAVVLFACASSAAASDIIIGAGETRYVDSGEILPINPADTLTIESGGHLIINNRGTINNYGTIENYYEFINWGKINNCGTFSNYYEFTNWGNINNGNIINSDAFIHNFGTIENCGIINTPIHFPNYGTINNYEGGILNCTSLAPNPVNNLSLPCPFSCSCEEVPSLTPTGIIALVSALSAIAAVAIVRKRR